MVQVSKIDYGIEVLVQYFLKLATSKLIHHDQRVLDKIMGLLLYFIFRGWETSNVLYSFFEDFDYFITRNEKYFIIINKIQLCYNLDLLNRRFIEIGIFITIIAVVSFPMNDIFLTNLPYPYGNYLSNTLWIGLIGVIVWFYRNDIRTKIMK